jgi:hypothetical protein
MQGNKILVTVDAVDASLMQRIAWKTVQETGDDGQ